VFAGAGALCNRTRCDGIELSRVGTFPGRTQRIVSSRVLNSTFSGIRPTRRRPRRWRRACRWNLSRRLLRWSGSRILRRRLPGRPSRRPRLFLRRPLLRAEPLLWIWRLGLPVLRLLSLRSLLWLRSVRLWLSGQLSGLSGAACPTKLRIRISTGSRPARTAATAAGHATSVRRWERPGAELLPDRLQGSQHSGGDRIQGRGRPDPLDCARWPGEASSSLNCGRWVQPADQSRSPRGLPDSLDASAAAPFSGA
jgi:hypothetical protein